MTFSAVLSIRYNVLWSETVQFSNQAVTLLLRMLLKL